MSHIDHELIQLKALKVVGKPHLAAERLCDRRARFGFAAQRTQHAMRQHEFFDIGCLRDAAYGAGRHV